MPSVSQWFLTRAVSPGRSQKSASESRLMKRLNADVPFSTARMVVKVPIHLLRELLLPIGSMPASSSHAGSRTMAQPHIRHVEIDQLLLAIVMQPPLRRTAGVFAAGDGDEN